MLRLFWSRGRLAFKGNNAEYTVKPGQLALYNREKGTMEIRDVDVRPYVAWKEHEFMFDNESLEEIMNTLSLWYDVDVLLPDCKFETTSFYRTFGTLRGGFPYS